MEKTTLSNGLKRLLRICPKLTLDPRAIQLIIDGKQNQVITEHRNAQKTKVIQPVVEPVREVVVTANHTVIDTDKSFDEYFQ